MSKISGILEVDSPIEHYIQGMSRETSDSIESKLTCMGNTVDLHLEVKINTADSESNELDSHSSVAILWQAPEMYSRNPASIHDHSGSHPLA